MIRKPRIVIVSSYGNPMAINLWIKHYEKVLMHEVDEVHIISGGYKYGNFPEVVPSINKLCELTNKKHNNNKLRFFYIDTIVNGLLSPHAHLLYHGMKVAHYRHTEGTVIFMDDDIFIQKIGFIDNIFNQFENGNYFYGGIRNGRELFLTPSKKYETYHSCLFGIDLKKLVEINDIYETCLVKYYPHEILHNKFQFIKNYSNLFGYIGYPKGMKFDQLAEEVNFEGGISDETIWLFSYICQNYLGKDKECIIDSLHNPFYPLNLVPANDNYIEGILSINPNFIHVSDVANNFWRYTFKEISQEEINKHIDILIEHQHSKPIAYLHAMLYAWTWSSDEIRIDEVYKRMQNAKEYFINKKDPRYSVLPENINKLANYMNTNIYSL